MEIRTNIINLIFEKYNFHSYLEIGVYYPENNFNHIKASLKHSVDNLLGAKGWYTHHMSSDEFFYYHAGNQKYDVIFIDAMHEENQCYRDVKNSIKHLNEDGFIVIHDCDPFLESHIISYEDFINGPCHRWNGTVYRAFIRLKNELKDWSCFVVEETEAGGSGILTKTNLIKNTPLPFDVNNFSWNDYLNNRKEALQLISFDEYKQLLK